MRVGGDRRHCKSDIATNKTWLENWSRRPQGILFHDASFTVFGYVGVWDEDCYSHLQNHCENLFMNIYQSYFMIVVIVLFLLVWMLEWLMLIAWIQIQHWISFFIANVPNISFSYLFSSSFFALRGFFFALNLFLSSSVFQKLFHLFG